jgi:peptidoglycan/xylan/chitin deacetylase (PgdA/CDA1 family)
VSARRRARGLVKRVLCALLYHAGILALVARWCPRRTPVILCAHRVVAGDDPFFPGIRRERFAVEVAYLARHHHVLPLPEVVTALVEGRPLPRGAVAITFDDGFADNFTTAWPILRAHGVPATIFVVSDSVETGRLPWPDRLAYLLRDTRRTTLELRRPVARTFALSTRDERLHALDALLPLLKGCDTDTRRAAMEDIEAALEVGPDRGLMVTWEQCRTMAGGGVTFGAHTLTHPILPRTDGVEVKREVADSKAAIEARLGVPVRFFAYPNDDWSPADAEAVDAAGFDAALGGARELAREPVDRLAVGRRPWSLGSASVFAAEMSGVLDWFEWLEPFVGILP